MSFNLRLITCISFFRKLKSTNLISWVQYWAIRVTFCVQTLVKADSLHEGSLLWCMGFWSNIRRQQQREEGEHGKMGKQENGNPWAGSRCWALSYKEEAVPLGQSFLLCLLCSLFHSAWSSFFKFIFRT